MIEYRPDKRLYTLGGPQVIQRIPAASSDWWDIAGETCVAAYQPKGAASLAASYVNLANPGTYDAAPGTAPTWDATNGWIFASASSQYLTTGITPANNQTWSMAIRHSGMAITSSRYFIGSSGAGSARFYIAYNGGRGYANGAEAYAGTGLNAAVQIVAGNTGYLDGSQDLTEIGAWAAAAYAIFIGARNALGSPNGYSTGNIQAIAIYSTTLDAAQAATLSAAMAAL